MLILPELFVVVDAVPVFVVDGDAALVQSYELLQRQHHESVVGVPVTLGTTVCVEEILNCESV